MSLFQGQKVRINIICIVHFEISFLRLTSLFQGQKGPHQYICIVHVNVAYFASSFQCAGTVAHPGGIE